MHTTYSWSLWTTWNDTNSQKQLNGGQVTSSIHVPYMWWYSTFTDMHVMSNGAVLSVHAKGVNLCSLECKYKHKVGGMCCLPSTCTVGDINVLHSVPLYSERNVLYHGMHIHSCRNILFGKPVYTCRIVSLHVCVIVEIYAFGYVHVVCRSCWCTCVLTYKCAFWKAWAVVVRCFLVCLCSWRNMLLVRLCKDAEMCGVGGVWCECAWLQQCAGEYNCKLSFLGCVPVQSCKNELFGMPAYNCRNVYYGTSCNSCR